MKIIISGASDDLVELEGDIVEEYSCPRGRQVLAFGDGTCLRVRYTNEGLWRIDLLTQGSAIYTKVEAFDLDDEGKKHPGGQPGYSDVVTLEGDLKWVAKASAPKRGGGDAAA